MQKGQYTFYQAWWQLKISNVKKHKNIWGLKEFGPQLLHSNEHFAIPHQI